MSKHTPGPWSVHPMALMAVHQPKLECWIPQSKADARLIAAAPDLLEALREYRAAILFAQDKQALMSAIRSADDKARAAIAKAEGEKT